jgi:hypothetical protein
VFLFSHINGPKVNGSSIAYAQAWCASECHSVERIFTQREDVDAFAAMLELIPSVTKHVVIPTSGHLTKAQRAKLKAAGAVIHVALTAPRTSRPGRELRR